MNKKQERLFLAGLIFSAFLVLCAVINLTGGHMGAAVCALGAGIFFLILSAAVYQKNKENKE